MPDALTLDVIVGIDEAVKLFGKARPLFEGFAQALMAYFQTDPKLAPYIHFIKYRVKDPEHLRAKLIRKAKKGQIVNSNNLFDAITDLAGIRIIHLHTTQMKIIHQAISSILEEQQLRLVEDPNANCWDVEYEEIFKSYGIKPRSRPSMYTTVHYVIRANQKTNVTCEVQLRTLMDEVWGEVSHRVNYPEESKSVNCQDQLKVLARLTTGGTRLVDSIFGSHSEALSHGSNFEFRVLLPDALCVELMCQQKQWEGIPMLKGEGGIWTAVVWFPAGDHPYKFRINGAEWILDPENTATKAIDGVVNSVVTIHKS